MNSTAETETKSTEEIAQEIESKIRAMSERAKLTPTIAKPFDARKRDAWLDKWLKLETAHHPDLHRLADAVYAFCSNYAKQPASGQRLVVFGPNGTGKSHCARAVSRWAKRIAIELPLVHDEDGGCCLARCEYVRWPAFCHEMRSMMNHGDYWPMLKEIASAELMVIDDVGAEHDPSRWAVEQLYLTLEARESRWTLITTNSAPDQWESRFEKRIASRLLRNTILVSTENVPDYHSL